MSSHAVDTPARRWLTDSRAALPLGIWFGLSLIDAMVLSRRWSGALTVPLSAPLAAGSCLVISAVSVAALVFWRLSGPELSPRMRWLPGISALVWPVLWGAAFSPGLSAFAWGGLAACAGMLFAATGLVCLWVGAEGEACETASERDGVMEEGGSRSGGEFAGTDWQRRVRLDEGEAIEGSARVTFAAGQKEALIHLAFCPPFSRVPELHTEDSEGGDLEIRVEAIYPFGARLSVRRSSPFDATASYDVAYMATEPEQSAAA